MAKQAVLYDTAGNNLLGAAPGANGNVLRSDGTNFYSGALTRDLVAETVTVSSAASLTLTTASSTYVFSGSAATSWTLPPVSGNTGRRLYIENRATAATGIITLIPQGADLIWFLSSLASLQIGQGGSAILVCDGTYWNILSTDLAHDVIGILPVANGGTGLSAPGANGNVLTSNGSAWVSSAPSGGGGSSQPAGGLTAAVTTSGTSPTKLMSISVPANSLVAGSTFEGEFAGQNSAAATITGYAYFGPNGTTADSQVTSVATLAALSAGSLPFYFRFHIVFRSVGASAVAIAASELLYKTASTTSAFNVASSSLTWTVNTTVADFVTIAAAASAGTFTAYTGWIRQIV